LALSNSFHSNFLENKMGEIRQPNITYNQLTFSSYRFLPGWKAQQSAFQLVSQQEPVWRQQLRTWRQ
jgi:hypothetical protein